MQCQNQRRGILGDTQQDGFWRTRLPAWHDTSNHDTSFVVHVGSNKLPVNAGTSWTVNPSSGNVQGEVGVKSVSHALTSHITEVSER